MGFTNTTVITAAHLLNFVNPFRPDPEIVGIELCFFESVPEIVGIGFNSVLPTRR